MVNANYNADADYVVNGVAASTATAANYDDGDDSDDDIVATTVNVES